MQELSCLRAKRRFLAADNEHAMRVAPLTTSPDCAELVALLSSSSRSEKKTGHKQVFQRTNTAWGILGSLGELNKQGSYRFKGTAKNLWRHVWTGATVNSLAS